MQDKRGLKWQTRDVLKLVDGPRYEIPDTLNFDISNSEHHLIYLPFYTEPMWPRHRFERHADLLYIVCAKCKNMMDKIPHARVCIEMYLGRGALENMVWRLRLVCCATLENCSYLFHVVSAENLLRGEMARGWTIFLHQEKNQCENCRACGRPKCAAKKCRKFLSSPLWKNASPSYERFILLSACFQRVHIDVCTPLARRFRYCFQINCKKRHTNIACTRNCRRVFYCSTSCRDLAAVQTHHTCTPFQRVWDWFT